jgi:hypothetical protein
MDNKKKNAKIFLTDILFIARDFKVPLSRNFGCQKIVYDTKHNSGKEKHDF